MPPHRRRHALRRCAFIVAALYTAYAATAVAAASLTNVAIRSAASASTSLQQYGPANAVDGDPASYFESASNSFPQWLAVDLGAAYALDHIALFLPTVWGSRSQTLAVAVAADASSYSTLLPATVYTFQAGVNAVNLSLPSSPSTTARYVKLTFSANSGWPAAQLSELQVFASPAATSTAVATSISSTSTSLSAASSGTPTNGVQAVNVAMSKGATASSFLQSFPPTNAVDGDQSTYWESQSNAFPQTLLVDLASAQSIDRVVMRLPPSLAWGTRSQTLVMDGSLDGATFFSIKPSTAYTFTANSTSNAASVTVGGSLARYVRLTFTANSAWPAAQMSELEIYPVATSASATITSTAVSGGNTASLSTSTSASTATQSTISSSANFNSSTFITALSTSSTSTITPLSSTTKSGSISSTSTSTSAAAISSSLSSSASSVATTTTGSSSSTSASSSSLSSSATSAATTTTGSSSSPSLTASTITSAATSNLAPGKFVTVSSFLSGFPPAAVVDGDQTTYWESNSNAFPQALQVDLAVAAGLDHFVLRLPPSLAWGTRSQTLAIDGSLDGSSYFSIRPSASYIFTANSTANAVTIPANGIIARYIRLTITANSGWPAGQLSEFEAYSVIATGSVSSLSVGATSTLSSSVSASVSSLTSSSISLSISTTSTLSSSTLSPTVTTLLSGTSSASVSLASLSTSVSTSLTTSATNTATTAATTVGPNAALRKPATASGFVQNYGPSNAFDGDPTTYWESTNNALPQYLRVDLLTSMTIDHFIVRLPPALAWGTRSQTLYIEGSSDGASFFTITPSATYTFTANSIANSVSIPAGGTVARYVRVTVTANSAWPAAQISELEVYPTIPVSSNTSSVATSTPSISGTGATVPYFRYDSLDASIGGGASLQSAANFDQSQTASEASGQSVISLPSVGAYAKWTIRTSQGGDGITMRFTMPDTADGLGLKGSLAVLVNDVTALSVDVSSYWNWQYTSGGVLQDAPGNGASPFFRFDEVHFRLGTPLKAGDTIAILKSIDDGIPYGVDFLEIETVPAAIPMPSEAVSVTSFGAVADDGVDDLDAFNRALAAAVASGVPLYIPSGTWNLGNMWVLGSPANLISGSLTISGAGMWYTKLQFTNPNRASGGVSVRVVGSLDFSNIYMNSMLRSRYGENAVYKGLMDNFGSNSVIRSVWIEHFECGIWVGDYSQNPAIIAQGLTVKDSRIRNNLADGVNFSQGTSNSAVINCSLRNNGDDSLAVWPSNYNNAPVGAGNRFAGNTIENNWRASGIGIFGGYGHTVQGNLVTDCFASPGIRLTTDFPGFHFQAGGGIVVSGNAVARCGTAYDMFGQARGQIDLVASGAQVAGIHFTNNALLQSQQSGVQLLGDAGYADV
ncbi:hypothetical protein HK405_006712, partial [Cladochytrium tenue]